MIDESSFFIIYGGEASAPAAAGLKPGAVLVAGAIDFFTPKITW